MPGLLDELKTFLPAEEFAKLEGNAALKARLLRGEELRGYYDGDPDPVDPPAPPSRAAADPPPAPRTPPSPGLDLSGIERILDARLARLDERIDTRFNTLVEQRGTELVNNAAALAVQRSDELNRVYHRHFADFGEQFDSTAFNDFLNKPENSVMQGDKRLGSKYPTITAAYEAMTSERRTQNHIRAEVDKQVKEKTSGQHLPGTTPGPAMNSNIRVIMSRGRATDPNGQPASRVDKAAAALDRRMADAQAATA